MQPISSDPLHMFGTTFFVIIIIMLYMLPTIVAMKKKHVGGIALLNIFLGWTFIGWFGALIWAVTSPVESYPEPKPHIQQWFYTCCKCGYKRNFDQKLKLYKCPQCGEENYV